jgi:TPR repeat protein
LIYENGLGVTVDVEEAVRWYKIGALQGHEPSMQKVKVVS